MSLIENLNGRPFFDEWESQPESVRQKVIGERLAEYIGFARENVEFYRERLEGFEPGSPFPLARVPVLTANELREVLPPKSNGLVMGDGKFCTVFQSGGTTGFPKTTLFSHEELELLTPANARGFYALGLSKDDRVANMFAVGGLYMTFLHINRMLQEYGCMNFPFSNHTPSDFVHTVVKLFNVNAFAGITSVVLNCLRQMHSMGMEGIRIEKIFYGGEHIYETDKNELREKFGVNLIAAPGYGTVDTWYIGYQCLQTETGVFHAHDDQCFIEIVSEDTGQLCVPGEVGMLYATALPRRLTPIVRYRVGDRAQWLGERCSCGRTTPLFKLLGRGDDVLRVGFDSVDYNYIQESVSQVKGLLGTVQMEKLREEGKDRLVIRAETDLPASEYNRLSQTLDRQIVDNRPSLRHFIEDGTVWPLKVEISPAGSLPRNPRTGKLIRVIDAI